MAFTFLRVSLAWQFGSVLEDVAHNHLGRETTALALGQQERAPHILAGTTQLATYSVPFVLQYFVPLMLLLLGSFPNFIYGPFRSFSFS